MADGDLGEGFSRQSFSFQETGPSRSTLDRQALEEAALEGLSDNDRLRHATVPKDDRFQQYLTQSSRLGQIDVSHLKPEEHRAIVDKALQTTDQDNEKYLRKLRERMDRVGIHHPTVEVRFEDLNVDAEVYVGSRALPSLTNSALNILQAPLRMCGVNSNKRDFPILKNVTGVLKPGKMTLLLGPPGAGKSTLLLALAGKSASDLKVKGKITYNGTELHHFVPQRASAYISQSDTHTGELTVRETFDFATRVQGPGYKAEMIDELTKREASQKVAPDPDIDAYLKASSLSDKQRNVGTEYILRVLGLDYAADTVIGSEMMRGISGGQKKRVTTGEMIVGPKKVLLMDEISTGLDSSTTFQIVKAVRNWTHLMEGTVLMALLQPAPETFELFDDVLLLSEGFVVYHGPVSEVLGFFQSLGFTPPARKGIADFLQEVTSKKDQEQYWSKRQSYSFVPVAHMAEAFKQSRWGKETVEDLSRPVQTAKPLELSKQKYALGPWAMFRALLRREIILMKRNRFLYTFRTVQCGIVAFITATFFFRTTLGVNIQDGSLYLGVLFFSLIHMLFNGFSELAITVQRLPVFYKQRDDLFYTGWAFNIPTAVLRIPYSFMEATIWTVIVYYVVGFAPQADRFFAYWFLMILIHSMALALFRLIAALGRKMVIANTGGSFALLVIFLLGGFILSKPDIKPWWVWGYWISPLAYAQNAIAVNEFTAPRWQRPDPQNPGQTLGFTILRQRGLHTAKWWLWVGFATLIGFYVILNILVSLALQYLPGLGNVQAIVAEDAIKEKEEIQHGTGSKRDQAPAGSRKNADGDIEMGAVEHGKAKAPSVPRIEEAHGEASDLEGGSAAVGVADVVDGQGNFLYNRDIVPVKSDLGAPARDIVPAKSGLGTPARSGLGGPKKSGLSTPSRSLRQRMSMRSSGLKQRSSLERVADKGMILPFQPLAMTFSHVNYAVDMPKEFQKEGQDKKLRLLNDISGTFRPGVLTALMGVSGAGKTTLMDVLAGRKTGGYIEGDIRVGGFKKVQETFARISGYVEQNDIHSPQLTVLESLRFSAWLRLSEEVDSETRNEFVDEVMELVELTPIRGALVGLPGSSGLSVEQRKRLTIAVELVANPSIIFMDEPTSGLDARAAAIVMRAVRNTVNTGRTVVCTIHQPSIDIFESFDELLLLKRGGRTIYAGSLGKDSSDLIKYFKGVNGVPDIPPRYNPAAWMLDSTTAGMEEKLHVDFADVFKQSESSKELMQTIEEGAKPAPNTEDLKFDKKYSQNPFVQTAALLWKNNITYWRTPEYNFVRFLFCTIVGLIFGTIYWNLGTKRGNLGQVLNVAGGLYAVVLFLGVNNASTVQPVVAVERGVSYRERAAGMYSPIPYATAQGLIEFPYVLAQTIIYSAITYSMIHFEWTAAKFFWYTLFMFLTLIIFTFYGMMAVAITPNVQLAAVISSAFYSIFNLFAGFLLPRPLMPSWWKWVWYLDPVAWSLYGLVGSQLGDIENEFITNQTGQRVSVADYVHQYFGYKYSFLGWVVFIMCAFVLAFWAIVIFSIKKFNFQKR